MKNTKEIWKKIDGYDGYEVSKQGRIKNTMTGRILKPQDNGGGYEQVTLCKDGKSKKLQVHRLVAQAFIDNPNDLETVNHIDEDKHNNNVENLEWLSSGDNTRYSQSKQVNQYDLQSGRLICTYSSLSDCCRITGFNQSTISMACRGMYKRAYDYIWRYKDEVSEEI